MGYRWALLKDGEEAPAGQAAAGGIGAARRTSDGAATAGGGGQQEERGRGGAAGAGAGAGAPEGLSIDGAAAGGAGSGEEQQVSGSSLASQIFGALAEAGGAATGGGEGRRDGPAAGLHASLASAASLSQEKEYHGPLLAPEAEALRMELRMKQVRSCRRMARVSVSEGA